MSRGLTKNMVENWYISYIIEPVAVLFGLLSVWFAKKEKLISFPFGIINVLAYVYIFFMTRLYANAAINAYFFLMLFYGWYNWARKKEEEPVVKINRTGRWEWLIYSILLIIVFILILWILRYFSGESDGHSSLTFHSLLVSGNPSALWDALTTSLYMLAQWMISRKKIENWLLWIVGDTIMTVLCLYQNLWFTAFQYAVFTGIATSGFLEWKKKLS